MPLKIIEKLNKGKYFITKKKSSPYIIVIAFLNSSTGYLQDFLLRLCTSVQNSAIFLVHYSTAPGTATLSPLPEGQTKFSVQAASHGLMLKKNNLYIAKGDNDIHFKNDRVSMQIPATKELINFKTDHLFESLTASANERSLGIVISDDILAGVQALKAIESYGGLGITQKPSGHFPGEQFFQYSLIADKTIFITSCTDAVQNFILYRQNLAGIKKANNKKIIAPKNASVQFQENAIQKLKQNNTTATFKAIAPDIPFSRLEFLTNELKLKEKQLLEKEQRLQDIQKKYRSPIENSFDAFFFVGSKGQILEVNAASSKIFGYTETEFKKIRIGHIAENFKAAGNDTLEKATYKLHFLRNNRLKEKWDHFPCELSSTVFQEAEGKNKITVIITRKSLIKLKEEGLSNSRHI